MKRILAPIANIVAWPIYIIGLIAPLTPSEGTPTVAAWTVFVLFPLALLCFTGYSYTNKFAKLLVGIQVLAIFGFTAKLLSYQLH